MTFTVGSLFYNTKYLKAAVVVIGHQINKTELNLTWEIKKQVKLEPRSK